MNFHLGIKERKLVCRQAFRMAYGIKRDYLNTLCKDVRMGRFGAQSSLHDKSNPGLTLDPSFIAEMNAKLAVELTPDQKAAQVIGNSLKAQSCWAWMKYYFDVVGDYEPNTNGEIHLEPGTVMDIWNVYVREQNESGDPVVDYNHFCNIWITCFEYVTLLVSICLFIFSP